MSERRTSVNGLAAPPEAKKTARENAVVVSDTYSFMYPCGIGLVMDIFRRFENMERDQTEQDGIMTRSGLDHETKNRGTRELSWRPNRRGDQKGVPGFLSPQSHAGTDPRSARFDCFLSFPC
jgi:hypothetical protein